MILPGSGLPWRLGIDKNMADGPVAVQFTANSALAISRARVETTKYLLTQSESKGGSTISVRCQFNGFGREDKRSWITFHDGISNVPKGELRRQVVGIKPENAGGKLWSIDGTYMVFMRVSIDLAAWGRIPKRRQDLLVGRDRLTGCPFTSIDEGEMPVTDSRCPRSGTSEVVEPGNDHFREPPDAVPEILKLSHVQRANHHRLPHYNVDSRRIYRQGFEFLDDTDGELDVGLNFVSFQDDPDRTFFILTQKDWLGGVNFGGDPRYQNPEEKSLMSVTAAGNFYVPPMLRGEAFPGSMFFEPLVG